MLLSDCNRKSNSTGFATNNSFITYASSDVNRNKSNVKQEVFNCSGRENNQMCSACSMFCTERNRWFHLNVNDIVLPDRVVTCLSHVVAGANERRLYSRLTELDMSSLYKYIVFF